MSEHELKAIEKEIEEMPDAWFFHEMATSMVKEIKRLQQGKHTLAETSESLFLEHMVKHMVEAFQVESKLAHELAQKYISSINVSDVTTQHIGADYFAIQILMAEGIIPYKPI